MNAVYGALADLVVLVHFLYVLFAVGGEAFILLGTARRWAQARNLPFRIGHLVSVALVALEAATGTDCPLTAWEYRLRQLAGQAVEDHLSFIARLVGTLIYYDFPRWVFTLAHIAFGCLVVLTYVLMPPRSTRRR